MGRGWIGGGERRFSWGWALCAKRPIAQYGVWYSFPSPHVEGTTVGKSQKKNDFLRDEISDPWLGVRIHVVANCMPSGLLKG